ncbi:MAG: hypothetical protein ACOCX3_00055 [Chloroflexota bacterium]
MTENDGFASIQMPRQIWVEIHAGDTDARDVIVEMEDGTIFTSVFVTPLYIQRQMDLTFEFSKQIDDTIPARFCTLDVPHIVIEKLDRDHIEDTIDNLLAMEVFESVFTQVTENPAEQQPTTTTTSNGGGRRATQEVAAVVLSEVLVVEE